MKAGISLTTKAACLGAIAFWTPDVVVHAVRRSLFGRSDVLALTVTMPLILFVAWAAGAKCLGITARATAIRMLLGIWLLGGLFMTAGASFSGGGFVGPDGVRGAFTVIGMSLLPVYTFIMATCDGSLGGLLLVTAVLFTRWMLPLRRFTVRPNPQT
jgi:hypothetical protein